MDVVENYKTFPTHFDINEVLDPMVRTLRTVTSAKQTCFPIFLIFASKKAFETFESFLVEGRPLSLWG